MFRHVLWEVPFSYSFCHTLVESIDQARGLVLEWTGTPVSGCLGLIVYLLSLPWVEAGSKRARTPSICGAGMLSQLS